MINAIFSFHGRLGRLAYLGWMGAAAIVVFVIAFLFLLLGGVLSGMFSPDGMGPQILGILMGFTAAVVGIWTTLALQAKRIRDLGFAPLPWMLGVSVLMMADQWLVTQITVVRFFWPLAQYTPLGGLVATIYMIVLVCWPSADAPPSPAEAPRKPEPSPVARRAAAKPRNPNRTQFGLRSQN
jgi:uncharacterized membrane protein YhaH (DUF805 family)